MPEEFDYSLPHRWVDGIPQYLTPEEIAENAARAAAAYKFIPPITTRQFMIAAAFAGIITWEEAKSSSVPATIQAVFDSLPDLQKKAAEVTWARMTLISRDEPLVVAAAEQLGMTSEQIDQFFIQAASL